MRVLFRCIDRHSSGIAWAAFTLKSEPSAYTGKDCPQTEFKLYTTNPDTFEDFQLGELYQVEFSPAYATIVEKLLVSPQEAGHVEETPGLQSGPGADQPSGPSVDGQGWSDLGVVEPERQPRSEEGQPEPDQSQGEAVPVLAPLNFPDDAT